MIFSPLPFLFDASEFTESLSSIPLECWQEVESNSRSCPVVGDTARPISSSLNEKANPLSSKPSRVLPERMSASLKGLISSLNGLVTQARLTEYSPDYESPALSFLGPYWKRRFRIIFVISGSVRFKFRYSRKEVYLMSGNVLALQGFLGCAFDLKSPEALTLLECDLILPGSLNQIVREQNILIGDCDVESISKKSLKPTPKHNLELDFKSAESTLVYNSDSVELQINYILEVIRKFSEPGDSRIPRIENALWFFHSQWVHAEYGKDFDSKHKEHVFQNILDQLIDHISHFASEWIIGETMSVSAIIGRSLVFGALLPGKDKKFLSVPAAIKIRLNVQASQRKKKQEKMPESRSEESLTPETVKTEEPSVPSFSCSEGFGQLLRELGVTVLLSTYQGEGLLAIVPQDGQPKVRSTSLSRAMGMDITKSSISVATSKEIRIFSREHEESKQKGSVPDVVRYRHRASYPIGWVDPHDIEFIDNELWFVNTKFSCICSVSVDTGVVPRWRPSFISALLPEDRCHLNGLASLGKELGFASALGKSDVASGWRARRGTGGIVIDCASDDILCTGLSMPHSPRILGSDLFILESGNGSLSIIDQATGRVDDVTRLPGFSRGLDFFGDFAFIGLSKVRDSGTFSGIGLDQSTERKQCGLAIVDLRTGETAGSLYFENGVYEVFSVRVLPGGYDIQFATADDQGFIAYHK